MVKKKLKKIVDLTKNFHDFFFFREIGDVDSEDMMTLPEGTLNRNLGLDLIVVVTKTDYMADLERDYDYKEEHFDFIQQVNSKIE